MQYFSMGDSKWDFLGGRLLVLPFCASSCFVLLNAWWVSLPDKIPGYLGHRHQVIAAALPLQNIPLSFEKEIKDSPGSFSKWSLLLWQEHREALGCAVPTAPQNKHSTWASLATAAAVPVAQPCTHLEQPAQPVGTAVGISKSTSVEAWAEMSCLAASGRELGAVMAMPSAAVSPACCGPT